MVGAARNQRMSRILYLFSPFVRSTSTSLCSFIACTYFCGPRNDRSCLGVTSSAMHDVDRSPHLNDATCETIPRTLLFSIFSSEAKGRESVEEPASVSYVVQVSWPKKKRICFGIFSGDIVSRNWRECWPPEHIQGDANLMLQMVPQVTSPIGIGVR